MAEQINTILMTAFSGSMLLGELNEFEATDATPIVTVECPNTSHVETMFIDIISDKGGTVDVKRYLGDDNSKEGLAPSQQTIADGGGSVAFEVPQIGCLSADVLFTKTELGDTTDLVVSVRGEG